MMTTLRNITLADAQSGLALTRQMGWSHHLEDWQQALRLGDGVIAEHDGRAVGTALRWRWGAERATVGLVLVDTGWQGRGVGRRLMDGVLSGLEGCHVRLHATSAGQKLYARLGFAAVGEIRQYQCPCLPPVERVVTATDWRLRQAVDADAAVLSELDRQAHGLWRPALINELLRQALRLTVLERPGRAAGFAALRRFGRGYAIGPVIAGDGADARMLIATLLAELHGEFVRIDSDAALGLDEWLFERGLRQVDAPVMMIRGVPWQPVAGGMRSYGLMTQAMG
ncbi:GNAT family N-acetyltransferase [Musicola paradisiaca]|uniref:GCN5-related N-acetyltransferase n=1 Tax=Musicola paradisiaca (strain Ech703) TaxID=579405 RepID=C6CDM2_MUSP7|nr:GNAT family N-acetyltransferase [Musicola paradisiaca]ACS85139.1 GCN5-related N-acetyltransferase [Musicola paradisiaca Ech703]